VPTGDIVAPSDTPVGHSLTRADHNLYNCGMEVRFSPELEQKINRVAVQQGRDSESLVREAVERFMEYDEWFLREVERGIAAADRGEFIEHDEVGRLIESRYSR
jgi:predicted transcriptional regulator